MWNYLNPLPPHFAWPVPPLRLGWFYSPDSDPVLILGQISSIEWHQWHRCSRAPAVCCCSTCTLNYQIIEIEFTETITHQILHITIAHSSHSFRGLLQSMKNKTVNQIIWFINFMSVVWALCSPSGSVYGRGLSAQRGSRAAHPPCCPGCDWIKEVEESIWSASAVYPASVSMSPSLFGILMDKTFYQIKRRRWICIFVPFFFNHTN